MGKKYTGDIFLHENGPSNDLKIFSRNIIFLYWTNYFNTLISSE